jgi:hypothetical protein
LNIDGKHRSTPRRTILLAAFVLGCGTLAPYGCGDNSPARTVVQPLTLRAVRETVLLKPGGSARIAFILTTPGGIAAAGERLNFSAADDPQSKLAGATLSAVTGLTDADGTGEVTVTAGLQTVFQLTARHIRSDTAETVVVVGPGDKGTIAVISSLASGSKSAASVKTVAMSLFDNLTCAQLSLTALPQPVRPTRTGAAGTPAEFEIDTLIQSAVLGQGRDSGGNLRAVGCVDIPGSTVVPGGTVNVYLPLNDLIPAPSGTFLLASKFSLAKRDFTRRVASPWQDLGDCPLDPGQLWLDCAIDALGSPPGDALDCVPFPTGEGDLANLISARRGGGTAGSPCRAATLGGGIQGLDAKVAALFPSPAQAPANDIDSLGTSISSIFDDVMIGSTLSLEPTATPGMFRATHTLRTASFQVGGQTTVVDIVAQGAPDAQARFVAVKTTADLLEIDAHGLGLHLGTLAHVAFAQGALVGHGLPAATGAYLEVLFGLASSGMGATRKTGCDALDALVCADVGRSPGCLLPACVAGQAALALRLDAAFVLVDGDGADLQLAGSALMTDANEDGIVDHLGGTSQDTGLWTAQIRARTGTEIVSGSWSGIPWAP